MPRAARIDAKEADAEVARAAGFDSLTNQCARVAFDPIRSVACVEHFARRGLRIHRWRLAG
ncbi:hypothetical protein F01_170011 [Burkholderia cenocepacia]|nr:hypothetical protein F01_170011 [Burkholderia cenocepacia]